MGRRRGWNDEVGMKRREGSVTPESRKARQIKDRFQPPASGSRLQPELTLGEFGCGATQGQPDSQPLLFADIPFKLPEGVDLHPLVRGHARSLIGDFDLVARALADTGHAHRLAWLRKAKRIACEFRDGRQEMRLTERHRAVVAPHN